MTIPLPSFIDPKRSQLLWQAYRYAFAGGVITLLVAGSYWAISEFLHVDPMLSLAVVFLFFTAVSYVTHGAFSFRGHGSRDRQHVRAARFLAVNLLGFAANQFFVWLLVKQLGGPTWWPVIPIIFVTPVLTFALHRRWVFG
ncbi:GtrA family protein [Sphingomonas sinipercae]|uniref:GtrA family protein n=1 Tax=Sphingomonas sinipercae TaxID=2714944 RepID=A0A6G7ZL72_9SPHN|nr:GtrA family protein [Sphingomonas sinipercae]QIL01646.1 GtrA family protein [Sphingomonas sinipercae]